MIDFGLGLDLPAPAVPSAPAAGTATLDLPSAPVVVRVAQAPVAVVQQVTVSRPSESVGFAMRPDAEWGWDDLRDYVIREIEKRHGPQLRDSKKEAAIFKSFMQRYPDKAVAIAKSAFGPVHDGMWRNAPIAIQRFCKGSDPYFADVLVQRL